MESAGGGTAPARGFLHVGGSSVARHQLSLAQALGCERIVCIARQVTADLVALQHAAEHAGMQFHLISGPRQLSAQIGTADELFVIADGLLTLPQRAADALAAGPAVLVQPVEKGVEAGFERLDLGHAAAGMIRIPGNLVERLAELPDDCDITSALTRIALQAGIAQRIVPAALLGDAGWRLVRSEDEAQALEAGWIRLHLGESGDPAPGPALSRLAVLRLGPALLHAGKGARAVATLSGAMLLLALIAGWFGHTVIGMALCGAAWLVRHAAVLLARVECEALKQGGLRLPGAGLFGWACDAAIVLLAVWSFPAAGWQQWPQLAFAPLILILLLRLCALTFAGAPVGIWRALCEDRFTLIAALAVLALAGMLMPGIKLLAIATTLAAITLAQLPARLTRA